MRHSRLLMGKKPCEELDVLNLIDYRCCIVSKFNSYSCLECTIMFTLYHKSMIICISVRRNSS